MFKVLNPVSLAIGNDLMTFQSDMDVKQDRKSQIESKNYV